MITLVLRNGKGEVLARARVVAAAGKASRKALARIGAFVWQRARTSIRKAPKGTAGTRGRDAAGRPRKAKRRGGRASRPGDPPYSQTGVLRRFLRFAVEAESVVIGPELTGTGLSPDELPALEYGGPTVVSAGKGRRRRVRLAARPFMGPALEAEAPGFERLWKDSVR